MGKIKVTYIDFNGFIRSTVIDGGFYEGMNCYPPNTNGPQMIIKLEKVLSEEV